VFGADGHVSMARVAQIECEDYLGLELKHRQDRRVVGEPSVDDVLTIE
jgi:hypothetical protein